MSQKWAGSFRVAGFDAHAFTLFCSPSAHGSVGRIGDNRWNDFWTQVRQDAYDHYFDLNKTENAAKGTNNVYEFDYKDLAAYIRNNRVELRKDIVKIVGENLRDFVTECGGHEVTEVKDLSEYMVADYHSSKKLGRLPLHTNKEFRQLQRKFAPKFTTEELFDNLPKSVTDGMPVKKVKALLSFTLGFINKSKHGTTKPF
ncbi:hypothetical protein N7462_006296 [Penicillium macrosclerotiorum]|uniref:uncharacterized protein n=1 Tax=Penicillium macrosclerotiorum TaxID=303699 RepID=UPI00254931F8|nr:uncharacterized protein N7462_006296 [Penicillium macrosclerotiorum]KAJ5683131.1 hypothetical protein N7462_006296 [Penicillium macrosclerotiorum]